MFATTIDATDVLVILGIIALIIAIVLMLTGRWRP